MKTYTMTDAAKKLNASWYTVKTVVSHNNLGTWRGRVLRLTDDDIVKLGELIKAHRVEVDTKRRLSMTVKPNAGREPVQVVSVAYTPPEPATVYEETTRNGARYLKRTDTGRAFDWRASC